MRRLLQAKAHPFFSQKPEWIGAQTTVQRWFVDDTLNQQELQWANQVEDVTYEIAFVPPEHGVYYVFIECPSLNVKLNELPYMILDGREQKEAPAADSAGGSGEKRSGSREE